MFFSLFDWTEVGRRGPPHEEDEAPVYKVKRTALPATSKERNKDEVNVPLRAKAVMRSEKRSLTFKLKNGRTLGYALFGAIHLRISDPNKRLKYLIFNHGTPSTRLQASCLHIAAMRKGLCIVSIDRPGYGLSSPLPLGSWNTLQRQALHPIREWPSDVYELLDHLRINEYYVCGVSGGAPFTLACLLRPPKHHSILGTSLISGATPTEAKAPTDLRNKVVDVTWKLFPTIIAAGIEKKEVAKARTSEAAARGNYAKHARKMHVDGTPQRMMTIAQKYDQLVWNKFSSAPIATHRPIYEDPILEQREWWKYKTFAEEAHYQMLQGNPLAYVQDVVSIKGSWGFKVSEIPKSAKPILLFHGTDDLLVPFAHVKDMMIDLMGHEARLISFPGQTHTSILSKDRGNTILARVLS